MAILELVLRTRLEDQEMINRWNYVSTGTPAAVSLSFALTYAVGAVWSSPITSTFPVGSMFRAIQDSMTTQTNFVDVSVRNLYSTTDFYETPFAEGVNGTVVVATSNNTMTPFVTMGYTSSRIRTDVRRGQKRFSGVAESNVEGAGNFIASFLGTQMAAVALRMSEPLVYNDEGNPITFTPAICGKEAYTTPRGKTAYRYYASEVEQLENTAIGVLWQAKPKVRSQVSRQFGRGR